MKIVTAADFETEVLKSDKPVVVDFFATWCGPCKILAPTLDKIAAERADSLKIVKVDVDASPELAAQYGVRAMPTLMIFKDGEPVGMQVGAKRKVEILKWIDDTLSKPAAKIDLPKNVTLSSADRQKVKDALMALLDSSPDTANQIVTTEAGEKITRRQEIERELAGDDFYTSLEHLLTQQEMSVDDYINKFLGGSPAPAQSQITLSDADKKSLTEAFNEALNKSPEADVSTTLLTNDGSETTLRKMLEKELKDGSIFRQVEMLINTSQITLKDFVAEIRKSKLELPKPPKA